MKKYHIRFYYNGVETHWFTRAKNEYWALENHYQAFGPKTITLIEELK